MIRSKSKVLAVLVAALFSTAVIQPPRAEAGVAIAITSPALGAVASFMPFAGAAAGCAVGAYLDTYNIYTYSVVIVTAGAIVGSLIGLILLDGGAGNGLALVPVNAEQASMAGLTEVEWRAYNSEHDELNALAQTVAAEITASGDLSIDFASSRWDEYSQFVSADALNGMKKIVRAAFARLQAKEAGH